MKKNFPEKKKKGGCKASRNKKNKGEWRIRMNKVQNLQRIIILILAVAAIIFGIMQQEHMVVMKKAVNICMECIGVG